MWRLKIAEGGKDPYIFSTNNFAGRQIWEFDHQAGTPEERAKVEEARQNFYNNRFQVKPSSDLLCRMQVPISRLLCGLDLTKLFFFFLNLKQQEKKIIIPRRFQKKKIKKFKTLALSLFL
jgi:hypothetical protein